jgi:hypothetical protein
MAGVLTSREPMSSRRRHTLGERTNLRARVRATRCLLPNAETQPRREAASACVNCEAALSASFKLAVASRRPKPSKGPAP